MDELYFDGNGLIKQGQYGQIVGFLKPDGTLVSDQYSQNVLAFIESDGTIKADQYGSTVLGFVESDGTIKANRYGGAVLGKVNPPHLHAKAALFLIQ